MSLLSTKLKSKTNIGKPIIGSYCLDKAINSRRQNNAQDRLLNETKEKIELDLVKGNKTNRSQKRQLTESISDIRRVSLPADEWLEQNRERYEKWKDREREKLGHKHSRLQKFYRCPTFTSLDEFIRPVSTFDGRVRSASLNNIREYTRTPLQIRRKSSCRMEELGKQYRRKSNGMVSVVSFS